MKSGEPSLQSLLVGLVLVAALVALPLLWFTCSTRREAFRLPGASAPDSRTTATSVQTPASPAPPPPAGPSGADAQVDSTPTPLPSAPERAVPSSSPSAITAAVRPPSTTASGRSFSAATIARPAPAESELKRQYRLWREGAAAGRRHGATSASPLSPDEIARLSASVHPHDPTAEILFELGFTDGQSHAPPANLFP